MGLYFYTHTLGMLKLGQDYIEGKVGGVWVKHTVEYRNLIWSYSTFVHVLGQCRQVYMIIFPKQKEEKKIKKEKKKKLKTKLNLQLRTKLGNPTHN